MGTDGVGKDGVGEGCGWGRMGVETDGVGKDGVVKDGEWERMGWAGWRL